MKELNQDIINCELEYSKCFSEYEENKNIIRFRDSQLKDMYYHNFTFIKSELVECDLLNIIENEISYSYIEGRDYCNIILNSSVSTSILSKLIDKPNVSINGYYSYNIDSFSKLQSLCDCTIKKVNSKKMVDDILYCDLQHDEGTLGKDFCSRRAYRRGKVYTSDTGVNSYVCYSNQDIIGNCDLFIHNGVAKIEDFSVILKYQRKGYGTSILNHLIGIALEKNCHTIYLITDEEDTAKDMYRKLGFEKIGERTDLFFRL